MAVESGVAICKFFQSGYCKFKLTCKKKHVTTVCDDKMCNQKGCEKRHPRKCKYVIKYGNCKLGPICAYSHDDLNRKIENERLEKKIDELIERSNKKDEIVKELLDDVKALIKKNEEKDVIIQNLVREVTELKSNMKGPEIDVRPCQSQAEEDVDDNEENEEEIIADFVRSANNSLKLLDDMENDIKKSRKTECMRMKFESHTKKLFNEMETCENPSPSHLMFIHNILLGDFNSMFDKKGNSEKNYKVEALKVINQSKDLFEEFIKDPVTLSADRP